MDREMILTDYREKIITVIDRIALLFFGILIFFVPISNAAIESCFGFIYLCFILRSIFKLLQHWHPRGRRPDPKAIKEFFSGRINFSLLVFYILIGLSMFVSGPLFSKSFHAWFFKWGEGFLLFYFAQVFLNKKKIKFLISLFLCSSLLINIDGLHQFIAGSSLIRSYEMFFHNNLLAVTATFRHYNDFATYLAVVFFLLLGLFFSLKSLVCKWALALFTPLVLINLFFTYSRGAWLSLIILTMLIFYFSSVRKIKAAALVFVLALLAIMATVPHIQQRFFSIFKQGGDADRFRVWIAAFLMYLDSPFIGKGIGTFMDNLTKYGNQYLVAQYAHNCYLQILSETGLLGLLSFFWFLGELFFRGYRTIILNKNPLAIGIFCSLLAFSIHSFFDTQFYSLKLAILFWILASFLAVYIKADFLKQKVS